MTRLIILFLALALLSLQAGCCHITRMSVGPYFQSGFIDCPVQPCGRYTKQCGQPCCYMPAKTTTCTTVPHCNPCAAKTTTCTSIPHSPPPCYEPYCSLPKIPPCGGRLAQCCGKQAFLPYGLYCDDCW